jgi:hypothetical protein
VSDFDLWSETSAYHGGNGNNHPTMLAGSAIYSHVLDQINWRAAVATGIDVDFASFSSVGFSDTTEATIRTYTVPANSIIASASGVKGTVLHVTASGRFSADAHSKTVKLKWGGTTIATVQKTGAGTWSIDATLNFHGSWDYVAFMAGEGAALSAGQVAIAADRASARSITLTAEMASSASNGILSDVLVIERRG